MDVYVIVGEKEAGKSSVTRSLTGCWKNGKREIATTSGNVKVYVQLSSLQESRATAADFMNKISHEAEDCTAVLLSLGPAVVTSIPAPIRICNTSPTITGTSNGWPVFKWTRPP